MPLTIDMATDKDITDKEFLTVKETARLLRVDYKNLYELIRQGKVPAVRIGRAIRIPRRELYRCNNVS